MKDDVIFPRGQVENIPTFTFALFEKRWDILSEKKKRHFF